MDLGFRGGSETSSDDLQSTLDCDAVKMNIEGTLKIDGEVGSKKRYAPRTYLKKAESSICGRFKQACDELRSTGNTIYSA